MKTHSIDKRTQRIIADYLIESQSLFVDRSDIKKDGVTCESETIRLDPTSVTEFFRQTDWSFTNNDTTYLSHDIHPYPAKFIPQIPEAIIKRLSFPGEIVWDPFGGSGTTALEALLNNRNCICTDINPIGQLIGRAKTTTLSFETETEIMGFINTLDQFLNKEYLSQYIASHFDEISIQIPNIPNINKWFSSVAIAELAFIKHMMAKELTCDVTTTIAKASLSKIVNRVSNQESETRYSAVSKNILVGETLDYYYKDLISNVAKVKALGKLLGYRQGQFLTIDVMSDIIGNNKAIQENQIDLIMTSPPYPNAFDYHLYHRFRIFWLDNDPREMAKVEIGSHLRYQKQHCGFEAFSLEMKKALKNFYKALKSGRYAILVLGDAIFDGALFKTAEMIGEVGRSVGFEVVDIVERPLHETKRSVQSTARRAKKEQILILRKPDKKLKVELISAPYTLWPYENELKKMELDALLPQTNSDTFHISSKDIRKLKELTFYRGFKIEDATISPTWQAIIENGDAATLSHRKDPKYITHGLHAYKGKFYPQLVRPLINISKIEKKSIIFDPFAGSGTVALESLLNGHQAFGCDINPIAVEIAQAKSNMLFVEPYELERQLTSFCQKISNAKLSKSYHTQFDDNALIEINRWFPKAVIDKMGYILLLINEMPDQNIQQFLKVILSSIIREISQQDPSDLRIRRRQNEILDAPVFELYVDALKSQIIRVEKFAKIRHFSPNELIKPNLWNGSSCNELLLAGHLSINSVDLIITSPPYATALPYIDTNRLSLLVLNGLTANLRVPIETIMTGTREINKTNRIGYEGKIQADDFEAINSAQAIALIKQVFTENDQADVGFRRKNMAALLYMYFNDMAKVLTNLNHVLKPSGQAFIVIGDTKTTTGKGITIIKTTRILEEMSIQLGWHLVKKIPISVTTENYKHIQNAITENTILWFRKP